MPLYPRLLYGYKRGPRGSRRGSERRAEGIRDDEHGSLGAAAKGDAARGGIEQPEEGAARKSEETRHLPVGLNCGLEACEGQRPPPEALQDAEERRLETGEAAWTNREI